MYNLLNNGDPVAEWFKALASQADIESKLWVRARLATDINEFYAVP